LSTRACLKQIQSYILNSAFSFLTSGDSERRGYEVSNKPDFATLECRLGWTAASLLEFVAKDCPLERAVIKAPADAGRLAESFTLSTRVLFAFGELGTLGISGSPNHDEALERNSSEASPFFQTSTRFRPIGDEGAEKL
jgi:hypothetical protein